MKFDPTPFFPDFRVGARTTDQDADAVIAAVDAFRKDPHFAAAANTEIFYGADTLY